MILAALTMEACHMGADSVRLAGLLPDSFEDWRVGRRDESYDRHTLYDYLDGGAELYLSYGFREMISRIYTQPEQPDIIVDIFDMGSSEDAFGVFSQSRETVESDFGQGSEYYQGYLLFWKDRYLVSILGSPETTESKRALLGLAGHIASAIPAEGPLPAIVGLLPEEGRVEESIRFFRHYAWLNAHYFIAENNLLDIDSTTAALLAKYGPPDQREILLLVQYPDEERALAAYEHFSREYLPELRSQRTIQMEDGSWTAGDYTGRLLLVVFNAPSETRAQELIGAVKAKLPSHDI